MTPFEQMRAKEALLTAEQVRTILAYDPLTGWLVWRERQDVPKWWNGKYAGKRAGTLRADGRRRIGIAESDYFEHRLAYLIMTGAWPVEQIDHRDPANPVNSWDAIRPATPAQNQANQRLRTNNRLGAKGVRRTLEGRFAARIGVGKSKQRWLGTFPTKELATAAYAKAAREQYGEFAPLQ